MTQQTFPLVLTKTGARVTITFRGEELGSVKDGARLIQRVDNFIADRLIYRESGFTATETGMTATAGDLR